MGTDLPAGQSPDVDADRQNVSAVLSGSAHRARVVDVVDSGFEVVLNKGERNGVKIGDRYVIYDVGPELFDFDTEESLGRLEIVRGTGYVTKVQEKICVARSLEVKQVPRPLTAAERIISGTGNIGILGVPARTHHEKEMVNEYAPFKKAAKGDFAKKV